MTSRLEVGPAAGGEPLLDVGEADLGLPVGAIVIGKELCNDEAIHRDCFLVSS